MGIGVVGGFSVCTWYLCEANYSDIRPGAPGSWRDSFRKRNKRKMTQEFRSAHNDPAATENLLLTETTAVNIAQEEVISSSVEEATQGEDNQPGGVGAQGEDAQGHSEAENTAGNAGNLKDIGNIDVVNKASTEHAEGNQKDLPPEYSP